VKNGTKAQWLRGAKRNPVFRFLAVEPLCRCTVEPPCQFVNPFPLAGYLLKWKYQIENFIGDDEKEDS
jgi:hypothetical protein